MRQLAQAVWPRGLPDSGPRRVERRPPNVWRRRWTAVMGTGQSNSARISRRFWDCASNGCQCQLGHRPRLAGARAVRVRAGARELPALDDEVLVADLRARKM